MSDNQNELYEGFEIIPNRISPKRWIAHFRLMGAKQTSTAKGTYATRENAIKAAESTIDGILCPPDNDGDAL